MFTGIIENTSKLVKIEHRLKNYTLVFQSKINVGKNDIGTSISIDGVCLTLVKVINKKKVKLLFFNASPETLKLTTLRFRKIGDFLNLERSLKFGDEIAGHFVQGHIDDIGKIISIIKNKNSWVFWIGIKKKFKKYLIKKGSVTVNGISLTLNEFKNNSFRVDIIPHTYKKTNMKFLKKNMLVNIEYDLLVKFLKK